MKNFHLLPFLVISALLLLSSCTFQKRVHNRGFHIDWNGTKSTSAPQSIVKNQQLKKADKEAVKLDSVQTAPNIILPEPMPQVSAGADLAEPIILPKAKENYFKKEFNTQKEQLKKLAKPLAKKAEKEINILAIVGLMLALLSILGFFVLTWTIALAGFEEYIFLVSILSGFASIIFSSVALFQFKNNSEKWMGKGIAIAGLILGILSLLIWLMIIAIIFRFIYFF